MQYLAVASGIPAFDAVVQGLREGDNVVWQVDSLEEYRHFAVPFAQAALARGDRLVYIRFAPHPPVLAPCDGLEIVEVDPGQGFDYFSRTIHETIEARGQRVLYIFDNLSALVNEWATDELLANFFQVTCPFLFELRTVTYFALTRGHHAHSAVARIRDTTQVLIDVYEAKAQLYLHPVKVWDRYSPQMFLPHVVSGSRWQPLAQSGDAAEVVATGRRNPLQKAVPSIAPWETVYQRLSLYCGLQDAHAMQPECVALRHELCRMMIGNHPDFSSLANTYFTISDLVRIRERLIGSGCIGGKAAGMLLARAILQHDAEDGPNFADVLEEHDSFYIGSDVFFTFLVHNDLFRLRLQLTRDAQLSREEFADVEQRFLAGDFPAPILDQFRNLLDYFGQAPIIVRSSSLLEDSFGNAFAGKYRSEFCANQGTPDERLEEFLRAVKLVYASALNPDALTYRRKRGLGESDEQMAILVQRVSGRPHGPFFFPTLAGVAFSRNLYAWSDRIDPRQGVIRLVYGLGTRAVERAGTDYPRMIAVSNPQLRPEIGQRVIKYSQRQVDVLNLASNTLETLPSSVILDSPDQPNRHYLVSLIADGDVSDPVSNFLAAPSNRMVLTFNNLIRRTKLVAYLGAMLAKLDRAYGRPVDTEFTASVDVQGRVRINLLQCRPLFQPGAAGTVSTQQALPPDRVLYRTNLMIRGGEARDVRFLLYIDPRAYSTLADPARKATLGRLVGRINRHPEVVEGKIIMMGPGRWGSSNIDLGVNVGYADIDNAAVLVEVAREEAGHLPEVSYGTHFFQDLVEAQIIFLAVYPDEAATAFNHTFFTQAPNALTHLLPDAAPFADLLRLYDLPAITNGRYAQVIADAESQTAVCYLEAKESSSISSSQSPANPFVVAPRGASARS